ncbi:MAG TPA: SDR family oxidoreductase [Myxococcota bacterium]|nr:SDR family oxidoreductase [Myxococcota bacterium]
MGICQGRVVIVTGGGRGIGREHALELARQGAKVVVNDLGATSAGEGRDASPAEEVAQAIRKGGAEAIVNGADIADFEQAGALVKQTLDAFGRLDAVVNNAGILRDRMFVNGSVEEWDAIMRVHLRGHFCLTRHACAYWRDRSKAGERVAARIVNTSSSAGLQGSVGQSNYAAAKAGIAALTLVQAVELARYGITANAIAPSARTRLTESVFPDMMRKPTQGFDVMDPANIAPLVAWLCSEESGDVTGRVFEIEGGKISVADGWRTGPAIDRGGRWDPAEVGDAVREILSKSVTPQKVYGS